LGQSSHDIHAPYAADLTSVRLSRRPRFGITGCIQLARFLLFQVGKIAIGALQMLTPFPTVFVVRTSC
jgi:hypothetical protein